MLLRALEGAAGRERRKGRARTACCRAVAVSERMQDLHLIVQPAKLCMCACWLTCRVWLVRISDQAKQDFAW